MSIVVRQVVAVKLINLPHEICDVILTYLFYQIAERTRARKNVLTNFIKTNMVRYEDYNKTSEICVWGLGFFPYDSLQIQNVNCTVCGEFLDTPASKRVHAFCKCVI